jgi:uncharacterized peroxidase-related enzyme
MAHIHIIEYEEADGQLKDIYDQLISSRGKLAEIHKVQSLNPDTIMRHMDLYMSIMFGKSPLRRQEREMIATVVSSYNKCEYCIVHHGEALNHFWKNQERVDLLVIDPNLAELTTRELALCRYAQVLTLFPEKIDSAIIQSLALEGIEERALLDANLVISYFNFVNRIVLGLGVELEPTGGEGFDYD